MMSNNEYWNEATERAYWDACAQEEAAWAAHSMVREARERSEE